VGASSCVFVNTKPLLCQPQITLPSWALEKMWRLMNAGSLEVDHGLLSLMSFMLHRKRRPEAVATTILWQS
jgi:hypothetical protein